MNFTTKIPITKSNNPIDYNSGILSLGSCFAENMGEKFRYFKFQGVVNPFGIIFNPVSIEKLVSRIVNNQAFTEDDIFFYDDLWHCYEVHSELSHQDKVIFLDRLNQIRNDLHLQIFKFSNCIITYGTSWVYRNKTSEKIVANCHKVPQSQFDKEILSVEVIEKSIQNTIDLIRKANPNCTFIFTVSPVRHLKDGFVENQRSKAHLITAIQQILNPESPFLNYFPSYEIMMDELRDYRFYAEDMIHPSQTAIDYIWERFFENYISEENFSTMEEVCSIQKA
ncbi:MAG TPA: GSCFA domain-containing protein, partial [Flavobacterium sp.]|nr:GSCFA domain-containing protein [Flavobacterium sp.]